MNGPTLLKGDCLTLLPTLPEGSVDAIITDLPYQITACKWDSVIPFEPMWAAVKRVLKPNGVFVTTASQPFTSALVMSNPKMFKHEWVWRKDKAGNFASAKYAPLKVHESILVFGLGKVHYHPIKTPRDKPIVRGTSSMEGEKKNLESSSRFGGHTRKVFYDRCPVSILEIGTVRKTVHPTQKPVDLYRYLIRTYTNPGETVLDITMGSGTTGVAAVLEGRNFIGIEMDDKYFQIASDRVKEAQQTKP